MHRQRFLSTLPLLVLLAACSSDSSDEKTNEALYPQCIETRTSLGLDDSTTLGITAREAFASAEGEHIATLRWEKGGETELRLVVSGEPFALELVERKPSQGEGPIDMAFDCYDSLEAHVRATFVTEDGGFDESWDDLRLSAERTMDSFSRIEAARSIDLDELRGSYEPTELPPSEYDRLIQAMIQLELVEGGGFRGSLRYMAEKSHGDSVSARIVTAATWD